MASEDSLRKRTNFASGEQDEAVPKESKPSRDLSVLQVVLRVSLCFLCGAIFGVAIEKSRVVDPRAMRYQMVIKKMVMLKMFLSIISVGMFGLALLAMIPSTSHRFIQAAVFYYGRLSNKGVLSSVAGGLLQGIGMTICGTGPVMLFVQLGAGVGNSEYIFAGALLGTLLYGILKTFLDSCTKPVITESSNPWGNSPYFVMAMPVAAMFGMTVLSIEMIYPWTKDVKTVEDISATNFFHVKAWPPFVSGVLVGLLQIPLVLGTGETIAGSSSYNTILAQVLVGPLKNLSPYISGHRWDITKWYQVFYVFGAVFGGYLSAISSGFFGKIVGVPSSQAFTGGMLLILGTRVAGGGISAHGFSGMALLSILSVITVASMFAGAIGTGFMMKQFGNLKI